MKLDLDDENLSNLLWGGMGQIWAPERWISGPGYFSSTRLLPLSTDRALMIYFDRTATPGTGYGGTDDVRGWHTSVISENPGYTSQNDPTVRTPVTSFRILDPYAYYLSPDEVHSGTGPNEGFEIARVETGDDYDRYVVGVIVEVGGWVGNDYGESLEGNTGARWQEPRGHPETRLSLLRVPHDGSEPTVEDEMVFPGFIRDNPNAAQAGQRKLYQSSWIKLSGDIPSIGVVMMARTAPVAGGSVVQSVRNVGAKIVLGPAVDLGVQQVGDTTTLSFTNSQSVVTKIDKPAYYRIRSVSLTAVVGGAVVHIDPDPYTNYLSDVRNEAIYPEQNGLETWTSTFQDPVDMQQKPELKFVSVNGAVTDLSVVGGPTGPYGSQVRPNSLSPNHASPNGSFFLHLRVPGILNSTSPLYGDSSDKWYLCQLELRGSSVVVNDYHSNTWDPPGSTHQNTARDWVMTNQGLVTVGADAQGGDAYAHDLIVDAFGAQPRVFTAYSQDFYLYSWSTYDRPGSLKTLVAADGGVFTLIQGTYAPTYGTGPAAEIGMLKDFSPPVVTPPSGVLLDAGRTFDTAH